MVNTDKDFDNLSFEEKKKMLKESKENRDFANLGFEEKMKVLKENKEKRKKLLEEKKKELEELEESVSSEDASDEIKLKDSVESYLEEEQRQVMESLQRKEPEPLFSQAFGYELEKIQAIDSTRLVSDSSLYVPTQGFGVQSSNQEEQQISAARDNSFLNFIDDLYKSKSSVDDINKKINDLYKGGFDINAVYK